jgi:molybdopterin molybdotransferase
VHSVAEALARIVEAAPALDDERVSLAAARGRIVTSPIAAPRPLPGFAASAMDGWAVRAAELPATVPVVDTIAAGRLDPPPLAPGTAVRIMTGAPLPDGADAVVILEDGSADGDDRVSLPAARAGDNVRQIGEDFAAGDEAIAAGTRLGTGELAALAALGIASLSVARRPTVAIIATGDELVDVTSALAPGQVVDSSAYMLDAQVRDAGGTPAYLGIARDDRDAVAALVRTALDHDVVITTGGVSAGDRDHVRDALADAGVELALWKVAMKPGKPLAFGRAGTKLAFGLPGNPVSSWVAFELFVRPALLAMQRAAQRLRPRAPVLLPSKYTKPAGRAHYLRAAIERDGARLVAHPHARQGSAMLSSLIGVHALIEIPADATEIAAGATVDALLLEAV